MSRISIIIPIHNAEKYLYECIASTTSQMSLDDELILIDDGSTDGSGQICEEMKSLNKNIIVIHQKNNGVSNARKTGIDNSHGEWITFVDADDTLATDSLDNLFSATLSNNTEMVVGSAGTPWCTETEQISAEEYTACMLKGGPYQIAPWGRLIKRSLFDTNTLEIPREIVKGEDYIMNVRLALNMTTNAVIINKKVYNYRDNTNGVSRNFKYSFAYEDRFYHEMDRSFNDRQYNIYSSLYIKVKLGVLDNCYYKAPLKYEWYGTELHNKLTKDIRQYGYKISYTDKLKFFSDVKKNRTWVWWIMYILLKSNNLKIKISNILK